jgi:hypothetical protein
MSRLPTVTDPLRALLGGDPHTPRAFPETSRYATTGTATLTDRDGRTVVYLKRRIVPSPSRFAELREVAVRQGDRLDNLAAQHLGDPELFWQLCDANGAMRPEELEALGRRLRITLPVDTPGPSRA